MSSGGDETCKSGSLPSKKSPNTSYRRGYHSSDKRFPMPIMEESQFLVRLKKETQQKLQVSDAEEEEEEDEKEAAAGELVTFLVQTDRVVMGEIIHSRLTMMKEFCQFDLYCQRGVIPDLLLVNNPPHRAVSLRDKSERHLNKKESGRRTSTGSLPF